MSSCEIIEGITLHHGDCRDIMRALPADHFDAIITDPPYGTGAMNIRSGMDAAGGSHPPNLMVSEAALAAAVDQGVNAVGLFRLAHTRSVCIYYTRASLLHRLGLGALPFRSARPPFTLCGARLSHTACVKYTEVRILVSSGGKPPDRPKEKGRK